MSHSPPTSSQGDATDTHPHACLSYSEFVRLRNVQDQALNDRFRSIDNAIDEVKHSLGELRADVEVIKADIIDLRADVNVIKADIIDLRADVNHLRADVNEGRLESMRMAARFQNYTLKNPAMRITPVCILNRYGEIASPDPTCFPRNAKEFYSLRTATKERLVNMLYYLVGFYDVQVGDAEVSLSDSDSESGGDNEGGRGSPKQQVDTNWLAVEMLESILGLNEENFIRFKEKAAAYARRSPRPPTKRPNPPPSTTGGPGDDDLSGHEHKKQVVSRPSPRIPMRPRTRSSGSSSGERRRMGGEEGQSSSQTSSSEYRRHPLFHHLRSLDSNEDPIESPTNKFSTPEEAE